MPKHLLTEEYVNRLCFAIFNSGYEKGHFDATENGYYPPKDYPEDWPEIYEDLKADLPAPPQEDS